MLRTTIKKLILPAGLCLAALHVSAQKKAADAAMNTFISNLMNKMTVEEKIGQLNLPSVGFDVTGPLLSKDVDEKIKRGQVGGVFNTYTPAAVRKLQDIAVKNTRLHIPLIFGYDVIHGHRTIFPVPLAVACSWDTLMVKKMAQVSAAEATADGLNWTFSPMVDITRDPRWGRVMEGGGEDPWLGAQIAKAMVHGYQGSGDYRDAHTLMACVKHFALYGAAEAGRDYNTVDMSPVKMYNEYLPPYYAAVAAGVASVMTSFNEINGVPATGNKWLLTELLRKQWGFNGFVVTDYTAVNEMIQHGAGDESKVAELALNAGVEMDMVGELFLQQLPELIKQGKVSEQRLNEACRKVLEAKYRLGLFTDPYRFIDEGRPVREMMTAANKQAAQEVAEKSMVLLKNDDHILPLSKEKKIAFIGPLVKDKRNLIGAWSGAGDWQQAISVWDALQAGSYNNISYARGCNMLEDSMLIAKLNQHGGNIEKSKRSVDQLIDEAVQTASGADVVVAVLGETFGMSGEAASRSDIHLPANQQKLLKALVKTGKPVVLVLMNGRPLDLSWEDQHVSAILETWFSGTMSGPAIANILYGVANPSGKLAMTFPRNIGQVPIYYNHKNTGRPLKEEEKYTSRYLDVPNTPLYAFGHGLSYTTFSYGQPVLSAPVLSSAKGKIRLSVTVTNTGAMDGEEVVQLYFRDRVGSITRPVQQLCGAQKIMLKKGESRDVQFDITAADLKFYNAALQYVNEPGAYELMVGGSSDQVQQVSFTLE